MTSSLRSQGGTLTGVATPLVRYLAVSAAATILGCNGPTSPSQTGHQFVVSIQLTGPDRIAPGETAQFTATAHMSNGVTEDYTQRVAWRSADPSLAKTSDAGQVTALVAGEARIIASYERLTPSRSVVIVPRGTYRLLGSVFETDLPIAGATVAVVTGQGAGLSSVTNSDGRYQLYGVAGAIQVQVSKPGYDSLTRALTVTADDMVDFRDVVQSGTPITIAGAYTLSLNASTCAAYYSTPAPPDDLRRRTYTATVAQFGTRLVVTLGGADFAIVNGRGNQFEGRVQPDSVRFHIQADDYYYSDFDLLERVGSDQLLTFYGDVLATASPAGISGTLSGGLIVYAGTAPPLLKTSAGCYGKGEFVMTPAGPARVHR